MDALVTREARQAADGARRQLATCAPILDELGRRLRARPPRFVVTCARGSSDHAATYGAYLVATHAHRAVASVGPGVSALGARLALDDALVLAISQSGRSPDLLATVDMARQGGGFVVALVNDPASPLAALGELVIPLCAGEERAVPATKSYLLACLALLQVVAAWTDRRELHDAAARVPDALDAAPAWDLVELAAYDHAYVVGRGVSLGAAGELALKLKEACGIHAEAFSAAELAHGPIALVDRGLPVLALGQADETADDLRALIARLVALGAPVASVHDVPGATSLAHADLPNVISPLAQVQSFYTGLATLAAARGRDPDRPPQLDKITQTR
jgi:glucosamine--fructose-6-phosphate aminotransferase (isomerizing)